MIRAGWEYFKFLVRGLPIPPDKDFAFLKPGMLIFDVGANMGNYTALFAKRGAKVIAFEPQPFCFDFIGFRFMFNRKVKRVQAALGERESQMEMTISTAHTLSSLNPEWIRKVNESERFRQHGPKWDRKIAVAVTTLDKAIQKYGTPDYIKIDVEGFEKSVLSGLTQPVKTVSFEFTLPELKADALFCVDQLSKTGNYRYVSLSTTAGRTLVDSATLKQEIEAICATGELSNGDIFAHLDNG